MGVEFKPSRATCFLTTMLSIQRTAANVPRLTRSVRTSATRHRKPTALPESMLGKTPILKALQPIEKSLAPRKVEALPVIPPVYVQMSSLIPGKDKQAAELVAELDPSVFNHPIRRDILHLCVVHHLDNLRQGTASTKTRSEVAGSGSKILRQKGSGKARAGEARSPIRRGGGISFGPKPRDFSTELPRKVREMGMRVALSVRVAEQRFGVVESLEWQGEKTGELYKRIDELGWRKTLFVTGQDEVPVGLGRASGNLDAVSSIAAQDLTVHEALRWQRLVLDTAAVDYFERTLGKRNIFDQVLFKV